ncbi:MAG: HAD family phosphatase [Polyangiaceae bacterium]|nr:HAD family phosphatase [Polyangiaceae bacterium]
MSARAALFDMDRTLLRIETASLYVRHQWQLGEATWKDMARALFWVGQYTLGVLDVTKAATLALAPLKGVPEILLASRCDDWFRVRVEPHITDEGRLAVARHRAAGDICAIVTGATTYSARPLARLLGIDHLVSTELEVDAEGRFTGRPSPPLCYGEGKVERALRLSERLGFRLEEATFYSDSISDLPLLERVREPVCVNPDVRLRRVASRRGWRTERW